MKITTRTLFAIALIAGITSFSGCGDDDDDDIKIPPQVRKGDVTLNFSPKVGGQELDFDSDYNDIHGNEYEFSMVMFFLSDVYAVDTEGQKHLISEIELIDFDRLNGTYNTKITGELPVGGYERIEFGSGVKESLNGTDPSEFGPGHPLNQTTGMYWTWATKYIFHKFEGRVTDPAQDTSVSWFFHTGLDDLYRASISIERTFSVQENQNVNVGIIFDFEKVLTAEKDLDLFNHGQTHTTDALELATDVVNNTSKAFE